MVAPSAAPGFGSGIRPVGRRRFAAISLKASVSNSVRSSGDRRPSSSSCTTVAWGIPIFNPYLKVNQTTCRRHVATKTYVMTYSSHVTKTNRPMSRHVFRNVFNVFQHVLCHVLCHVFWGLQKTCLSKESRDERHFNRQKLKTHPCILRIRCND